MKKVLFAVLLCAMVLSVLFVPVSAESYANLAELMTNQVNKSELDILGNEKLYDEEDAESIRDIDFSQAMILVDHCGSLMELGELPLKEALAASSKYYFVVDRHGWRCITINKKDNSYYCLFTHAIKNGTWYMQRIQQHLKSVADSDSNSPELCGKQRDVLELYAFSENGMHALVYVTTEGTFVRLYTGIYAEDGNTKLYQDMTMEEYCAWVAAFRDFQGEYHTVAYTEYGDPNIRTLGQIVHKYGTPDAYYQDMQQIHIRKDRVDFWFPIIITGGICSVIAMAVFVFWRRGVNRKKYGYQ